MTLILVVSSVDETVLVADRRLTANGKLCDEDASKEFAVLWPRGRMLAGFTGLAKYGAFETHSWLVSQIAKALESNPSHEELAKNVASEATKVINALPGSSVGKRLSIVLAGYTYAEEGVASEASLISNYERLDGSERYGAFEAMFPRYLGQTAEPFYAVAVGMATKHLDEGMRRLVDLASKRIPASGLQQLAIKVLRDFAESPYSKGLVGKWCSSMLLSQDPTEPVLCQYHPSESHSKVITPEAGGAARRNAIGRYFSGYGSCPYLVHRGTSLSCLESACKVLLR